MKIEQQVCTLGQAKRLKELGVAQVSFFAWIDEGQLLSRHSPNLKWCLYTCPTTIFLTLQN